MGQNVSPKRRNVILRFKNPEVHWRNGRRENLQSVYYCSMWYKEVYERTKITYRRFEWADYWLEMMQKESVVA